MAGRFFLKYRLVITYGIALALILFLLRWLELRLLLMDHATELYIGAIAVIFTSLGIWVALKLARPKTIVVEKKVYLEATEIFIVNQEAIDTIGLSKRELEVLELMAAGLSNQEIASRLFVSLNTVKTHSSKLFEKMDVNRRTQAVDQGKRLGLIQ